MGHEGPRGDLKLIHTKTKVKPCVLRNGVTIVDRATETVSAVTGDIGFTEICLSIIKTEATADAIEGVIRVEIREVITIGNLTAANRERHTITTAHVVILTNVSAKNKTTGVRVTNVRTDRTRRLLFDFINHINQVFRTRHTRRLSFYSTKGAEALWPLTGQLD